MGRSPRRPRLARASALAVDNFRPADRLAPPTRAASVWAAAALALAIALGAASPAGAAGWKHPFRIAGPVALDVVPVQLAFSAGGEAAIGYGVDDEDDPANSNAFAAKRSARGRLSGPRRIPGAQQVLALVYEGPTLELLTGTSPKTEPCCSSVSAVRTKDGGFGSRQTLLSGLAGATLGRLVALPSGLLAAFATEHGVWVAQSSGTKRFARTRRLTASRALPESLDAASLPGGNSIVVWTARPSPGASGTTSVFAARGTQKSPPRRGSAVLAVPSGHRVDELAVASGPSVPTVAWIESWFDSAGAYHSRTIISDLRRGSRPKLLSAPDALAAGLSLTGDAAGDQAVAWKECTVAGDCAVRAVLRPARRRFSATSVLSDIDASQTPSMAISSNGDAVLAWIQQGHVLAVQAPPRAARFGPVQVVSATNYAADLSVAFGTSRQALAAWTQGTLNQSPMGAVYSAR